MRVACHQPYFLPPLSFFAKWASVDCLILLDELQFVRKSSKFHYANRCKLGDDKWFTIPVIQVYPQRIRDIQIVEGWQPTSLLDRIKNDYRKTPYVSRVVDGISEKMKSAQGTKLSTLNVQLLAWAAAELDINKPIYLQSELSLPDEIDRDLRLVKLVKAVRGDTYVAGPSGSKYMKEAVYREAGLKLQVCRYDPKVYDRGTRPWIAYMSVVDALCYQGEMAAQYIQGEIKKWPLTERIADFSPPGTLSSEEEDNIVI